MKKRFYNLWAIKTKLLKYMHMYMFLTLKHLDVIIIMLMYVKMPTIFGILTFMSKINFMLSRLEHVKSFRTSRPWSWIFSRMNTSDVTSTVKCHVLAGITATPGPTLKWRTSTNAINNQKCLFSQVLVPVLYYQMFSNRFMPILLLEYFFLNGASSK